MSTTPSQPYIPFDASAFEGPRIRKKREVPDGLWLRCTGCETMLYRKQIGENMEVCPECDYHFRVGAKMRVEQISDPGTFEELCADVAPTDPLEFTRAGRSYAQYVAEYQAKTDATEAMLIGVAYVRGRRVALGVMNSEFIMGSMGCVVGEKVAAIVEHATEHSLPLIIVCASGGARMQEGALSLMQLGKTSAALARYDDAGGLYVAILTDPTLAGVSASFAMLGDITLAEPGAMVGFTGARVIANTIKAELPEGFQTSEFLLEHGFIDRIVHRQDLRNELARLIDYCIV